MAFILLDYTIIHLIIYGTSDDYLGFPNKNIEIDVQASNRNTKFYSDKALLSGENSPKQLLLINNQLVTKLIKFFD